MSQFLELPLPILVHLIAGWLSLADTAFLHTAMTIPKKRDYFQSIISHNGAVFHGTLKFGVGVSRTKPCEYWIVMKNISINRCELAITEIDKKKQVECIQ